MSCEPMTEIEERYINLKLLAAHLYDEVNKDEPNFTLIKGWIEKASTTLHTLILLKCTEQKKNDLKLDVDIKKLYELRKALAEKLRYLPPISICMRILNENNGDIEKSIEYIDKRKYSLGVETLMGNK